MNKKYILLLLLASTINGYCQRYNISGVYSYLDLEYLKIDKNKFEIIFDSMWYDNDSIASFGEIEYIDEKFIKLTSDRSFYWSPYESLVIYESQGNSLTDSLRIEFIFPYSNEIEINIRLNISSFQTTTSSKILTVPLSSLFYFPNEQIKKFSFLIYNKDIRKDGSWGDSFSVICFPAFPAFPNSISYELKNKNTNVLVVEIPDLTNSYFARYFINEEYAKVEKDKIIWRGRVYEKIK